jgi:hypothetical protein
VEVVGSSGGGIISGIGGGIGGGGRVRLLSPLDPIGGGDGLRESAPDPAPPNTESDKPRGKQLDPNSQECKDLAQKIANI